MIAHGLHSVSAPRPLPIPTASGPDRLPEGAGPCEALRFGNFLVLPSARTLLRRGSPVALGSRAFDLLVLLLRSRGKIVSKEEIVRHVWPSLFVEESNLRFQMASLRRALGEDRDLIKTIPGRGYLLAADIESSPAPLPASIAVPWPDHRQPPCEPGGPAGARMVVVIERHWELRDVLRALLDALESGARGAGSGPAAAN